MIGKGKSISHTRASMSYGWNQEKDAKIVYSQNIIGETPKEVAEEFRFIQELNQNCEKNTLSFVISPTIDDGKYLQKKDLSKICEDFMKEMNLKDRQAIAFVHQDKSHKHIHLYVNRIDFQGQAYKDSFIGKRSQQAAEKVAEKMQLTTVKQVQWEKEHNLLAIRTEIKRRHDLTIRQFKPRTFPAYIKAMETNGVKVIPSINKANKLQGFRFEFDNYNLKGSEIHRSMTGGNIGKSLASEKSMSSFLKENTQLNLAGKTVELSTGMVKAIAKQIIKKTISKGLDMGM
ncbi:relaxase/mobilization nuclease domain-containing protein [Salegentibacter flavus]|uniref:Relaxase/Mobilisation nuclease domain-containing protein n=1 Tax=Salegentibacter flavus TaxID=287099 RepID=A0A1I4XHG7_9FLAO|nr:relaxase/mobilization nuclease domain-containing protein [Salegentibacter flavus]SFN25225.1 Relaxase/Mobilisation nuclease domain-containing protein [Salegentibacter flavus]